MGVRVCIEKDKIPTPIGLVRKDKKNMPILTIGELFSIYISNSALLLHYPLL
ncbi:predicted protein [Plenodomus lingam JN3]|uniref:Predicted protein n=1 Tax=Leptosphaeria maculans (strain JN3 / isolate v23.1.3 / race Av1-4-5-6-7-8) TaxID=985895 RepID=E4ZRX7_LEPMJ|nr:predicted protein [Plenodomus lingam JN3]CBX90015.1 predicted protein [Plenodomus lingam JN3]